ncbi:MAG TPA: trypsin-like peptidase domain-containing protein [Gemmataceae bacterium]|nr:trypsin-like peptidase domain-containing protein [Gemmataceae bacterium]
MRSLSRLFGLLLLLSTSGPVRGDDDPLKQALALQAAVENVIAKAEPSIACILVSRSEKYQDRDMAMFQRVHPSGEPGNLGDFDFEWARGKFEPIGSPKLAVAKRLDLAAPDHVPDSYGSGVVIDNSGLVLTDYHVVKNARKIYVRVPHTSGSYADIFAADERSDLAVLKLIAPPQNLKALPMGDAGNLRKGQFIVALANPFAAGFRDGSPSASWGILSNLRRRLPGEPNEIDLRRPRLHYYGILLQTDFRLSLGSSGGALLDLNGNWVGLTTSQAALAGGETAGGFAIPFDPRLRRIIDTLHRGEEVEYGFLGISMKSGNDSLDIAGVAFNGPAAKAGLSTNCRILKINGETINETDDLLYHIAANLAGTEIQIEYLPYSRDEKVRRFTKATLVKAYWPSSGPVIAAKRPEPVFGLRVDYSSTLIRNFGANEIAPGVLVREVLPDSPAAKAGLKAESDVILAVNDHKVSTPQEFYDAARKSPGGLELTLADTARKVRIP